MRKSGQRSLFGTTITMGKMWPWPLILLHPSTGPPLALTTWLLGWRCLSGSSRNTGVSMYIYTFITVQSCSTMYRSPICLLYSPTPSIQSHFAGSSECLCCAVLWNYKSHLSPFICYPCIVVCHAFFQWALIWNKVIRPTIVLMKTIAYFFLHIS